MSAILMSKAVFAQPKWYMTTAETQQVLDAGVTKDELRMYYYTGNIEYLKAFYQKYTDRFC